MKIFIHFLIMRK